MILNDKIKHSIKSIEQVAIDLTNVRSDVGNDSYCVRRVIADLSNQLCESVSHLEEVSRYIDKNLPQDAQ